MVGQTGEKNPNWKGGRSVASNGYVLIRVGVGHHLADVRGYAYEHRLVAEKTIGRRLRKGEEVHHRDENKLNNTPGNLVVKDGKADHQLEHRRPGSDLQFPGEINQQVFCKCGCGTEIWMYDQHGRPRSYVSGHNSVRGKKGQFKGSAL